MDDFDLDFEFDLSGPIENTSVTKSQTVDTNIPVKEPTPLSNYEFVKKYSVSDTTKAHNDDQDLLDKACQLWTALENSEAFLYNNKITTSNPVSKLIGIKSEDLRCSYVDYLINSLYYTNQRDDADVLCIREPMKDNRFMKIGKDEQSIDPYIQSKGTYTTLIDDPNISDLQQNMEYTMYGSTNRSKQDNYKINFMGVPNQYTFRLQARLDFDGEVLPVKNVGLFMPFLINGEVKYSYLHFCKTILLLHPELCLSRRNRDISVKKYKINHDSEVIKAWRSKYSADKYHKNFLKLYIFDHSVTQYDLFFSIMVDILEVWSCRNIM